MMKSDRSFPYHHNPLTFRVFNLFKSSFHPLETGKGVFYVGTDLNGGFQYTFNKNLIALYDRAITTGNLHGLSIEQQRLLALYFAEADTITPPDFTPIEDWVYDYDSLSVIIQQLDVFLGSFTGE